MVTSPGAKRSEPERVSVSVPRRTFMGSGEPGAQHGRAVGAKVAGVAAELSSIVAPADVGEDDSLLG